MMIVVFCCFASLPYVVTPYSLEGFILKHILQNCVTSKILFHFLILLNIKYIFKVKLKELLQANDLSRYRRELKRLLGVVCKLEDPELTVQLHLINIS